MSNKPTLVLDPEQREEARKATEKLKDLFPSMFMSLNIAQYRALEDMYKPIKKSGQIPKIVSVEFANGVGKSHLMWLDITGWTMGTDYLDVEAYPEEAIKFWNDLKDKRDSGKLALRLTCTADDMKAGGSVYELLKKVLPWAKPTKQDNSGCYRQIDIPHPSLPNIINHIAIKTFDQPKDKHSGTTNDRIWSNENLPLELWGETIARTRGGGTIAMFATILDFSSYLDELEGDIEVVMRRSKGHMYESCRGEQVTDAMAAEVAKDIGIVLEKNPNGGYITNGVLTKYDIETQLSVWLKTCPHELNARKTGRPISCGGKIHPNYDEEVHMKREEYLKVIPERYPIVQIVDPHPARPDASIWGVILPNDRLHVVAEWPTYYGFGYFEAIKDNRFTVSQKCDIWRNIENDMGFNVCARVGDPNLFRNPNPNDLEQLSSMYSAHGFDFDLSVNDNLELGFGRVNEYLYFDKALSKTHPNDPAALPRITFSEKCINTNRAVRNLSRKISRNITDPITEKLDDKFACFASCVRYFIMWHTNNSYNEIVVDDNRLTDYQAVKMGREPGQHREKPLPFNSHGRTQIR